MKRTNHLLLHCSVARELWCMGLCRFGVHWVMPFSLRQAVHAWNFFGCRGRKRVLWQFFPSANFWCLWKERNRKVFDSHEKSVIGLKFMHCIAFLSRLECWILVKIYRCSVFGSLFSEEVFIVIG